MSEATKYSPSPRPTTSGGPLRTATIFSGSSADITTQREQAAQPRAAPAAPRFEQAVVGAARGRRGARRPRCRSRYGTCGPRACSSLLQLEVVLDDAVVDDDDAAAADRDAGARSPRWAGRAWPSACGRCRRRRRAARRADALRGCASLPALRRTSMPPSRDDGDAGRVVAAILEPPEPVEEDGDDLLGADVADDAAHGLILRRRLAPSDVVTGPMEAACRPTASTSFGPAVLVLLAAARDARAPRGHVLRDRRPGGDVGARADADRRDQLRIAADEGAVVDDRRVLRRAVVVAGDRAGADVHLRADRRVAEVGEVVGLRLPCRASSS